MGDVYHHYLHCQNYDVSLAELIVYEQKVKKGLYFLKDVKSCTWKFTANKGKLFLVDFLPRNDMFEIQTFSGPCLFDKNEAYGSQFLLPSYE